MATKKPRTKESSSPKETPAIPARLLALLKETAAPKRFVNPAPVSVRQLRERLQSGCDPASPVERLVETVNRIKPDAGQPVAKMPEEIKSSVRALKPEQRRLHGSKISLTWFPFPWLASPCADKFGYMSSAAVRSATKLPFNAVNQSLLGQLGGLMGDPGRDPNPGSHNSADQGVSSIPAGYTYFGQFVDHDITLDVSSSLDSATDANTIPQYAYSRT